jgi:galactose mutarotase-like enzyme
MTPSSKFLQQRTEPYPHWSFSTATGDELRIVPERGGLVTGWRSGGQEWLYFDAERFADPTKSIRGGIPVLFPICGGLAGSPLPQHGFARDLPWQLQELSEVSGASADAFSGAGVRLRLVDTDATRAVFPHAFQLELDYRLTPGGLAITARVSNTAPVDDGSGGGVTAQPLPFSLGLHPYFAVQDLAAVRLEGLPDRCFDHIPMAEAATAGQLERLASGVDFLAHPSGAVRLLDSAGASGGRWIAMHPQAPLDLAVVWTEPPRSMVCLEPWTAPRGAMASGDRLLQVQPGETLVLSCSYRAGVG